MWNCLIGKTNYTDAPSCITSKLNMSFESSNKRTTLSDVADITLEQWRFRWELEFQVQSYKLDMDTSIFVK